jgi:hypothetical protein
MNRGRAALQRRVKHPDQKGISPVIVINNKKADPLKQIGR